MNDLNTINRLNQDSVTATAIKAARAAGKFVIAKYDGLHLVGHEEADTHAAADDRIATLDKTRGFSERLELLAPTAAPAHA